MYSSISELHQNIDKKVLPKEYGGEMPMAEMIGNCIIIIIYFIVINKYVIYTYCFRFMEKRTSGVQRRTISFRQDAVTNR